MAIQCSPDGRIPPAGVESRGFQWPKDRARNGVEYLFYAAFREYKDYPDVDVSAPELRLSAAFDID